MKFVFIALIAAVSTADPATTSSTTTYKWNKCSSASDCKDGWFCCTGTKKADSTDIPAGTDFCVDPAESGKVPNKADSPYAGFTYFCSHDQHKAAAAAAAEDDARNIALTAAAAAVASAYYLA